MSTQTLNTAQAHEESMFEAVLARLDAAAKLMNLSEEVALVLKNPQKQVKVSLPILMDNGKMERKEMPDTSNIIAWFTPDIPVAAGPFEFQGQLPGLILEMDVNNGRQKFVALEISPKGDIASIKEPQKGKRVTREEFKKESDKMMDEMEKNNQGGGRRVIRIN